MTATLPATSLADRLTTLFWRKPKLLLALLLTPPLLWLGVVYLGALAALLLQSFYSIDEFSGMVIPEFTLKTYDFKHCFCELADCLIDSSADIK